MKAYPEDGNAKLNINVMNDHWFKYVVVSGLEFTNNRLERVLKGAGCETQYR